MLLTQEWPKFGNFLYFWLHAYVVQAGGADYRVMRNRSTEVWLRELPSVEDRLTIDRSNLRSWDRREWPPRPEYFQRFGSDYSRLLLHRFIQEMLLDAPLLAGVGERAPVDDVVVNVRRGDYTHHGHRENFGFELEPYLTEALRRAVERRPVTGILVVSDDVAWCRDRLHSVLERVGSVRYSDDSPPREDFRTICSARTLVCANSTFSYWGGYVSTVLHGPQSHVIAPDFHARLVNRGFAYQLHDEWDIVPIAR